MQNVFTDRRAYVNALTYELETETSASGKKSKQQDIDEYKKRKATVEFPDGHQAAIQLPGTGRDLQLAQGRAHQGQRRTGRCAEAGHRGQQPRCPPTFHDHMVDLTPTQIDGLKKKTAEWDPKIVQINVADANIVDRCESCHMNTREPLRITAAVMTPQGREASGRVRPGLHQPSRTGHC